MSRCEDANFQKTELSILYLNVLRTSHITFYGTTYQMLHEMYARCLVMYRNIFHKYWLNSVGNCDFFGNVVFSSAITINKNETCVQKARTDMGKFLLNVMTFLPTSY